MWVNGLRRGSRRRNGEWGMGNINCAWHFKQTETIPQATHTHTLTHTSTVG